MKKVLLISALCVLGSLLFTGCSKKDSNSPEKNAITAEMMAKYLPYSLNDVIWYRITKQPYYYKVIELQASDKPLTMYAQLNLLDVPAPSYQRLTVTLTNTKASTMSVNYQYEYYGDADHIFIKNGEKEFTCDEAGQLPDTLTITDDKGKEIAIFIAEKGIWRFWDFDNNTWTLVE